MPRHNDDDEYFDSDYIYDYLYSDFGEDNENHIPNPLKKGYYVEHINYNVYPVNNNGRKPLQAIDFFPNSIQNHHFGYYNYPTG